jgi:Uncharacterized protein conserved in bacteria (DUF2252)
MHAAKLLERYERWCDRALAFDPEARAQKHRRMAASPFAFLRGSYPVWLDRFGADAAHAAAIVPLGVGDLHVENFGTWLAPAGEAFGVNDYDETGPVPFTNDLTRLAASAMLAAQAGHLAVGPHDIAAHLWNGYAANRDAVGAVLLAGDAVPHVAAVAAMWRAGRPGAKRFASGIDALPQAPAGTAAPAPAPGFALRAQRTRIAGLGSRDHPRLVLDGELGGERAVFERKPIAPATARFLAGVDPVPDPEPYAELLRRQDERAPALRAQVRVDGTTVVRRLDPERGRIEIADLPHRRDEHALLWMMGYCTAAHHRLSADTDAFAAELDAPGLDRAARRMAETVVADHAEFCKHVSAAGHLHA